MITEEEFDKLENGDIYRYDTRDITGKDSQDMIFIEDFRQFIFARLVIKILCKVSILCKDCLLISTCNKITHSHECAVNKGFIK